MCQSGQTRGLGARLQQEHPLWYKFEKISTWFYFSSTQGETFEMRLAVKPGVDLPTMPTIRVYAVIGFPKVPIENEYWVVNRCQTRQECFSFNVYSITALSLQTASTAMRRFDHAPFFSMQKSEYTIPFYVKVLTRSISLTDKYIVLSE